LVTDVLAVAIKKLRSNSSNRQNVVEKNHTKALAPTAVFRSLAALRRRTVTVCYVKLHFELVGKNWNK